MKGEASVSNPRNSSLARRAACQATMIQILEADPLRASSGRKARKEDLNFLEGEKNAR
jgi:hypothetical protein